MTATRCVVGGSSLACEARSASRGRRCGLAVLLLALVVLGGCAAKGTASLSKQIEPAEGEPVGWLAASVGARGIDFAPYTANTVQFRPVGDGKGIGTLFLYVVGTMENYSPQIDVAQDNRYFLQTYGVAMRPGPYEIFSASMSSDSGYVSESVSVDEGIALRFEIVEGKVTYLGSYVSETFGGKNLFGGSVRAGGYYVVTDEQARDIALLQRKGALPSPLPVVLQGIPNFDGDAGGGIYIRHPAGDGRGLIEGRLASPQGK